MSAALRPHQRSFSTQWTVINAAASRWSKCRDVSVGCSATNRTVMPHPPSAQGPLWKSGWKKGKRGRLKRTETKQHLQDTTGLTNSEQLRLPAQDKASEPPPSDEELLRADGGTGWESLFSLRVWPLVGQPCSSGWPTSMSSWTAQTGLGGLF